MLLGMPHPAGPRSWLHSYSCILQVSKDDRSDLESSSEDEDSEPAGKKPHASTTNGTSGTNGYLITGPCSMDD